MTDISSAADRAIRNHLEALDRGDEAQARAWARRSYAYRHCGVAGHVYAIELPPEQERGFERWYAADRSAIGKIRFG